MKRFFYFLCFLLAFFFVKPARSQTIVRGTVRSSKGILIEGANVRIPKSRYGASTDSTGQFSFLTQLQGKHTLIYSAVGYKTDSTSINIKGDTLTVDLKIKDASNSLSMVSVRSNRSQATISDIKKGTTMNGFDVATTAGGAVADVVAALQTFPGAAPVSNETGFFVRGGAANETRAYFDGMLVKDPFGSNLPDVANRSRFSAFLFKEATFSTGGYSAQYGDALSSLLLFETKELPIKTSNEFSLLTLGAGAAHTQRMKNSSLVVGANYYNFTLNNSLFHQSLPWVKDPEQRQAMIQYKWQPSPRGMLKVFTEYSDTRLSFNVNNLDNLDTYLLTNTNKNAYINTNYERVLSDKWKIQTGVSYNHTSESGSIAADPYHRYDDVLHGKLTLTRNIFKKSDIIAGAEVYSSKRDEGYGDTARSYTDVLSAEYIEGRIYLTNKLVARVGGRAEYSRYLDDFTLAPRTTLTLQTSVNSQVSASYGVFYQKPDDTYLAQTNTLNFEKATHYILTYEYSIAARTFRVEGYYKDYANLTKFASPQYSGLKAYGPVLMTDLSNSGSGYARGIDIFWKDKKTIPFGEYYVSWSLIDTKRDYQDFPGFARPVFAPANIINVVAKKYFLKYKTQLSGTYTYSSGRPYYNPLNPEFLGDRTKSYNNLSFTVSYLPRLFKQFTTVNFAILNILGLDQVYGYRYSMDGLRREPVLPLSKRSFVLSLLINFGDTTFNH